jgi:hypothetical protein
MAWGSPATSIGIGARNRWVYSETKLGLARLLTLGSWGAGALVEYQKGEFQMEQADPLVLGQIIVRACLLLAALIAMAGGALQYVLANLKRCLVWTTFIGSWLEYIFRRG